MAKEPDGTHLSLALSTGLTKSTLPTDLYVWLRWLQGQVLPLDQHRIQTFLQDAEQRSIPGAPQRTERPTPYELAICWASHGYKIAPMFHPDKPTGSDLTTDPVTIYAWWAKAPDCLPMTSDKDGFDWLITGYETEDIHLLRNQEHFVMKEFLTALERLTLSPHAKRLVGKCLKAAGVGGELPNVEACTLTETPTRLVSEWCVQRWIGVFQGERFMRNGQLDRSLCLCYLCADLLAAGYDEETAIGMVKAKDQEFGEHLAAWRGAPKYGNDNSWASVLHTASGLNASHPTKACDLTYQLPGPIQYSTEEIDLSGFSTPVAPTKPCTLTSDSPGWAPTAIDLIEAEEPATRRDAIRIGDAKGFSRSTSYHATVKYAQPKIRVGQLLDKQGGAITAHQLDAIPQCPKTRKNVIKHYGLRLGQFGVYWRTPKMALEKFASRREMQFKLVLDCSYGLSPATGDKPPKQGTCSQTLLLEPVVFFAVDRLFSVLPTGYGLLLTPISMRL